MAGVLGGSPDDVIRVSAKTGEGSSELLDRIVTQIPPPSGKPDDPLRALVFDSYYDIYRGVVCYLRVVDGRLGSGEPIRFLATGEQHSAAEVGVLTPRALPAGRARPRARSDT